MNLSERILVQEQFFQALLTQMKDWRLVCSFSGHWGQEWTFSAEDLQWLSCRLMCMTMFVNSGMTVSSHSSSSVVRIGSRAQHLGEKFLIKYHYITIITKT